VVLKLKTPWRIRTTHPVISAREFIQLPIEWLVCCCHFRWF